MASQVEIASSAAFGCVLKDHNRRDRNGRDSNATQAAFQKNLKELVRDRLYTCISVASASSSSDENSRGHMNNNNVNHHQQRQFLRCLTNRQANSSINNNDSNDNGNDSSTIICKQARTLDRWTPKQAQEIASTIENQGRESEELLIVSQKTLPSAKENSHGTLPENSSSSSNLGASSLVQIWEARLNRPELKMDRSNSFKNNSNSAPATSRTSSASSCNDIVPLSAEEALRSSEIVDSATNEDSLTDWDSTAQSTRSAVQFRSSDAGERERVRIADIIKRLTSDSTDHVQGSSAGDLPSRRHSCGSDQSETTRPLSKIVNSPKIRGRQAFNDLLHQMEQERLRELESLAERQSVSRFPQRGRIQAMLRLRFLQRGLAIQNQHRSQSLRSAAAASNGNQSPPGSTIMYLRERFSSAGGGVDHATSSLSGAATPKSAKGMLNHPVNNEKSSTVSHVIKHGHPEQVSISVTEQQAEQPPEDSLSQISEVDEEEDDAHEEISAASDVTWQGASSDGESSDTGEAFRSTQSLNNWDENEMDDEEIVDQHDYAETQYDWFSDISRPRSYWEDQRQAWYQEMLTTSPDTSEIRQLLERRTVSTFLASDFRDRMDQLMETHVQRQVSIEDEDLDGESQERMGQLILSFLQGRSRPAGSQQEEDQDEVGGEAAVEEEEEFAEGQVQQEEVDEDEGQGQQEEVDEDEQQQQEEEEEESPPSVHSLSPFRTWNYSPEHHEVTESSEQASPTLPSQSPSQDRQYLASPSHASIEMELIYDLRGHMEQMQREMSELRKSMQTCIEMQAELQNSLKQEVHPVQGASRSSTDMATKKRTCCVCYEMQVDSFLYRCGHMCTCLKCAHELQWSTGKCPICRAPILDVVRAYLDS